MGLFRMLFGDVFEEEKEQIVIPTIMPQKAIDLINQSILPTLVTDKVILRNNEICHYYEKCINLVEKNVVTGYKSHNSGGVVRVMKGFGIHHNERDTKVQREDVCEYIKSSLFITSERIIVSGKKNGFSKKIKDLIAIDLFQEAILLQFDKKTYIIMLEDPNIANKVISLLTK